MKKMYLILGTGLFMLGSIIANGQNLVVDPATSTAMAIHASIINNQMNKTNNDLTLIQKGQLYVTGQLTFINTTQSAIYQGLSQVSALVNNLIAIKDIGTISIDILNDIYKAEEIAQSNPVLLLFAEAGAREFETRAVALSLEVTNFVTKGGADNLMDSGERSKLLNHIVQQMMVLRGVAFGIGQAMYWAKMKGIFASLNPWATWINQDDQIANDIIRNSKTLKQ